MVQKIQATSGDMTLPPILDTEGRFRGDSARHCRGLLHRDKGYIGTGQDLNGAWRKDFWEYDPAANTWTQKADFGGTERRGALGFSIGNKGYIGTGYNGTVRHITKTSGSMTLPPMPGHRRLISGGQRETVPWASPWGTRAT